MHLANCFVVALTRGERGARATFNGKAEVAALLLVCSWIIPVAWDLFRFIKTSMVLEGAFACWGLGGC